MKQNGFWESILFILIFSFYLFCFSIQFSFLKNYLDGIWLFIWWFGTFVFLMLCSGSVYGLITHSKVKAAFLGFSFPAITGLVRFVDLTSTGFGSLDYTIRLLLVLFTSVLIGVLSGSAGFLAANTEKHKNKRYFFYLISFVCLMLGGYFIFNSLDRYTPIIMSFLTLVFGPF